jgi:hypothetical protein
MQCSTRTLHLCARRWELKLEIYSVQSLNKFIRSCRIITDAASLHLQQRCPTGAAGMETADCAKAEMLQRRLTDAFYQARDTHSFGPCLLLRPVLRPGLEGITRVLHAMMELQVGVFTHTGCCDGVNSHSGLERGRQRGRQRTRTGSIPLGIWLRAPQQPLVVSEAGDLFRRCCACQPSYARWIRTGLSLGPAI